MVFYIAAGIYIFGAATFAIFASGEVQKWARLDGDQKKRNLTVSVGEREEKERMLREGVATSL